MRSLLEISEDFQALDDLMWEMDGDISDPAVEEAWDALFADLDEEADTKLDRYAEYIQMLDLRAAAREEQAKRYTEMASVDRNAIARHKERLKFVFQQRGWKKRGNLHRLSLCNNGGKTPITLKEDDPLKLPEEYRRVSYSINTDAIREALDAGESLEFAELGERGQHIRIK